MRGNFARLLVSSARQRRGQRSFIAATQADQSRRELFEIIECGRAFRLRRFAHLEARDQLTQIFVSVLRGAEQRDARRLIRALMRKPCGRLQAVAKASNGNLRADVRADSTSTGR